MDNTGKLTGYKTDVGGADTVFPFKSGILIPVLTFSVSCSARSSVLGSCGTNSLSGAGSSSTEFIFYINGMSQLSVDSGSCTYSLDSTDTLPEKTGTLDNTSIVDINGYTILKLTSAVSANMSHVGDGNYNNTSGYSGIKKIENLRIE